MLKKIKAFTLVELLIVTVILGVIAGFAIPSYVTARDRAREKSAVANLMLISDAMELHMSREESYPSISGTWNVDAINTNLTLAIVNTDMVYTCVAASYYGSGPGYQCNATSSSGWVVRINTFASEPGTYDMKEIRPYCGVGPCPRCLMSGNFNPTAPVNESGCKMYDF